MSKIYRLDLSLNNTELYEGCKVTVVDKGRYHLDTPTDSAVVIVATNALSLAQRISNKGYDALEITGGVPTPIYLTVFSAMSPFFKEVHHFDGKQKSTTTIPQPPKDFRIEPEDGD